MRSGFAITANEKGGPMMKYWGARDNEKHPWRQKERQNFRGMLDHMNYDGVIFYLISIVICP